MSATSLARPGHEHTVPDAVRERVRRGLALFRERSEEIEPLGHARYSVPSCTTDEAYTVDLGIMSANQSCSCPDFEHAGLGTCKHLIAAELFRTKIQRRRWRRRQAESAERRTRDLEHVGEIAVSVLEEIVGAGS